jgi:ribosome-binding protein aMBF1 (putative translation factor)
MTKKAWLNDHEESETTWKKEPTNQAVQGRPKVGEDKKRKPRFTMNLNDDEFELVKKASESSGQSQASLARSSIIKLSKEILKNI